MQQRRTDQAVAIASSTRIESVASALAWLSPALVRTVRAACAFALAVKVLIADTVAAAFERIARPLPFRYAGDRVACALLRVTGIEAGPTVLAGDFEKDLGLVVLPSVVMPCPADPPPPPAGQSPPPPPVLPLLANVSSIPSGPFTVTIPIAATYAELGRAMEAAMGGQLHFSREYPDLYLEKPEVYPSRDTVVIKLVLGGAVKVAGSRMSIGGELFFSGHPRVIDNQIVVPDLELTPGTADGLLKLKVLLDGKGIRDQAQAALRVDLSERIAAARARLSTELSFALGEKRRSFATSTLRAPYFAMAIPGCACIMSRQGSGRVMRNCQDESRMSSLRSRNSISSSHLPYSSLLMQGGYSSSIIARKTLLQRRSPSPPV